MGYINIIIKCNKFYLRGRYWMIWQHLVREGGRLGRLPEGNMPGQILKES